jgi:hypothetical protein
MNLLAIFDLGSKIIDRVLPDPQKKQEAQLELLKLAQAGEFKQLEADLAISLAQAEINKAEAQSGSAFKGGWRPLAGYVCVMGLAYQFLIQPLLAWASGIWSVPAPPTLDMGDLITILGGMLGLGVMRTKEKLTGKA